ncbi:MAG: AI-2E family transporter [Burkholderiaceae bacterium]
MGGDTLAALLPLVPEIKLLVGVSTAAVIIAALYFGRVVLVPLALAILLGFVLDPLVDVFRRWGLARLPAVIVVMAMVLALLGIAGTLLGNQVSSLSAQLPIYQSNIQHKLRDLREKAGRPGMFDGAVKTYKAFKDEVEKAAKEEAEKAAKEAAEAASAPASGAVAPIGRRKPDAPPPIQRVQVEPPPPNAFQDALGWVEASTGLLATAGIVLVFVVLVLLDRDDLRDRLLRLWGGSLHRSTDALDEAGRRITRYLTMQLVVNMTYGVPMAAGLWMIGVPGAILWGAVAAIMRFVPYVGPMISAVFPLVLAFAVDPGWSMVLWTLALIVAIEIISNNIVEPWLYGASTGLSAISLMAAATFWTALWGPVGLIMSTPLTVCLLVIGRHLPRLKFLDVLLGSQPALDAPTRIYQRLLADDVEGAIELATEQVDADGVAGFYNGIGLPALRLATSDASLATAEHRHRIVVGMEALIDDLAEQHPPPEPDAQHVAVCIGGKWELDTLAARMLAHTLSLDGQPASHRLSATRSAEYIAQLDLAGVKVVCISYFSPEPQTPAKHFCRRLRRAWPDLHIVLGLWNAPSELLDDAAAQALGADAVVTSMSEAAVKIAHFLGDVQADGYLPAPVPEIEPERLNALRDSGALDDRAQPLFEVASRRAAEIFDVPMAMVSLIGEHSQLVRGVFGSLPSPSGGAGEAARGDDLDMPRSLSMCGHAVANGQTLVVSDIERDLRFAGNPALKARGLRFYAGAPLTDEAGYVIGTLCILDIRPRVLNQRESRLLEAMARDLMELLRAAATDWGELNSGALPPSQPPSATVGQFVPTIS